MLHQVTPTIGILTYTNLLVANDHLRVQHWDETLDIDHDDYGIIWYLFCQLKVVMGWSAVDFLWPH